MKNAGKKKWEKDEEKLGEEFFSPDYEPEEEGGEELGPDQILSDSTKAQLSNATNPLITAMTNVSQLLQATNRNLETINQTLLSKHEETKKCLEGTMEMLRKEIRGVTDSNRSHRLQQESAQGVGQPEQLVT